MPTYLERYLMGEHERVWDELFALDTIIVEDEATYQDAKAVAEETMRRARSNVDILIHRLKELGYRFAGYHCPAHRIPSPDFLAYLDQFERNYGPLPLSLRAWYQFVGEVNLTGNHPDWKVCTDDSACTRSLLRGDELAEEILYIVENSSDSDELVTWLRELSRGSIIDDIAFPERVVRIINIATDPTLNKESRLQQISEYVCSIDAGSPEEKALLDSFYTRGQHQTWDVAPISVSLTRDKPSYVWPSWVNNCTGKHYRAGTMLTRIGLTGYEDPILVEVGEPKADSCISQAGPFVGTFVQNLRMSFKWGGFPGFANVDESLRPAEMLEYLKEGLLPI